MTARLTYATTKPLPSMANVRLHWRARAKITAQQRRDVAALWKWSTLTVSPQGVGMRAYLSTPWSTLTVTMTRVAPRVLDDDNNVGAFKAIRDEVAVQLGLADDRDPRVTWRYAQIKGAAQVWIDVEATS